MRLVRLAIWLATAFFVVMLFMPLVTEMLLRLTSTVSETTGVASRYIKIAAAPRTMVLRPVKHAEIIRHWTLAAKSR